VYTIPKHTSTPTTAGSSAVVVCPTVEDMDLSLDQGGGTRPVEILGKIADEVEMVSRSQKTGTVVERLNFKRHVVNETVDMACCKQ
jgi:hypothetical protein